MKIETRRVDLIALSTKDYKSINEVLDKSPNATIFHTVEWNQLLIEQFGLRNVTLLAMRDNIPLGLYSFFLLDDRRCWSPAIHLQSVYGGPISTVDTPKVITELLKTAERLQPIASFQIWTPPNVNMSPFLEMGYSAIEMYTPILSLKESEEEIWGRLHKVKRNMIRKAIKNDAFVIEEGLSSIDEYHSMVAETMGRVEMNVLPKSFYRRMIELLNPLGLAKLMCVKYNSETISGTVILYYKDIVYYWEIGWRREFANIAPNDLLLWEVARRAKKNGYLYFDLLRLEPDRLPSIAQWKNKFGGEVHSCYHFIKSTIGYRGWQGWRLVTNPRRLVNKFKGLEAIRHVSV